MPGFTTHYLFGIDAYKRILPSTIRENLNKNQCAFALGLQGPDIFFYYLPSHLIHTQNIGALAHENQTGTFFSHLLKSRTLFLKKPHSLAVADAYISGFLGHYTLDCSIHPYVYAFTRYNPEQPKKTSEYFGQHAYFETELDNLLLWIKKRLHPSEFHQNKTIRLNPLQRRVIGKMLAYAYNHTYPNVFVTPRMVRCAFSYMKLFTALFNDPTGQKKVLVRFIEKILLHRAFISPMLPSNHHRFIKDPMNFSHRTWTHPWTKETSSLSFPELYKKAGNLYYHRLKKYYQMIECGFSEYHQKEFLTLYGNCSFLSGLPLS